MELVSAVIITHNRSELLKKAVQSVVTQSYSNIECIVVDDASSDDTTQVVKELQARYDIKYIYISPQESRGANHARNVGWQNAMGEYIAFLDDDDEWLKQKIEKQMCIVSHDTPIVYCGRIIERNYDITSRQYESLKDNFPCGDLSREILVRIVCVTSTLLIEKQVLQDINGFDENLHFWQEYEMCIRAFQKYKVGVVKEDLILYREITSDKMRKTNNVVGWEENVHYIMEKHIELFSALNSEDISRHNFFLLWEGVLRARNSKKWSFLFKNLGSILKNKDTRRIFLGKVMKKIR